MKKSNGFTPLEINHFYYTYVIQSQKDGRWYTGSTDDLRKRFKEHNSGKVFSTKGRGKFTLIYYEACKNAEDARQREKFLKSGMGKRYLKNRTKRFLSLTGFTLVELLLYSAIVAFVLMSASSLAWQIIQESIKTDALREVNQNASFAMSKIVSATRNASSISAPTPAGSETNYLILTTQGVLPSSTEFRLSDGKITITEGSTGPYPLTSDTVEVTQLKFTNITASNTPGTVRIAMTIRYKNPSGRPEYDASTNLENSVIVRY